MRKKMGGLGSILNTTEVKVLSVIEELIWLRESMSIFIDSDNFVKSNSRLYYLLGTKNVRVKDTTKLKINENGFQSPNGNSLILFQANTKTYEEIRALIQFRMINCQNKEIIEELKNILSDKNLDEKHLYEKLKEENSLENLINEFQLFLLKNILLNIIFNQTKK